MNLNILDWIIFVSVTLVLILSVTITRRYMKSVSDFLAAGRTGGRYLLSMSQGMAMLGAITIIGMFEMNYIAGFVLRWWELTTAVVIMAITVSGWVVYRFRETRALTMAQFFEIRYSRKFRIFSGLLAFLSGIINFGIFPSVSAWFFIYFCGIPESIFIAGIGIPSFPLIMIILLSIALLFVFTGGQIAVMISDFLQGIFVNLTFIIIVIYFLVLIGWDTISEALLTAPENASLINPYKTSEVPDFNFWYFLIGTVGLIYSKLSWQGTQGYYTSARSAHEAKMGEVLGNWRNIPQWSVFLVLIPVVAYTILHHPEFISTSGNINHTLDSLRSETMKSQLRIPLVLLDLLPVGLIGAFAAVMFAAFISTHDTYLHSWGSIFIQDVIMPFRKKPFNKKQHLIVLKLSVAGVAVFIFFFSLLFQQSQYIFLFFAITGAIFTGGSGAVIIGGLYWKRGTTAAAWAAMITGSVIAVGGITIHQILPDFFINGQVFWGIAMAASALVYVIVSISGKKEVFNMEKLLHRGKYYIPSDQEKIYKQPMKGLKALGIGKEFSKSDRIIYYITYIWTLAWFSVFLAGTIINFTTGIDDLTWLEFWKYYILINLSVSAIVVIWFSIGGIKNIREMFIKLRTMSRDEKDDGFIENYSESESEY
ncbi:MAG: sodium/proline symporter PutP [Ignavibacteriaceae bacterium]